MKFLKKLTKRLKEPSTYASVTGVLLLFGINLDPGVVDVAVQAGAALSAVAGMLLSEKGPSD